MKRTVAAIALLLGTFTMLGSATAQAVTSPVVIHEIYYNSLGKDTGSNTSLKPSGSSCTTVPGIRSHWRIGP
jgi:hypothetical protein